MKKYDDGKVIILDKNDKIDSMDFNDIASADLTSSRSPLPLGRG